MSMIEWSKVSRMATRFGCESVTNARGLFGENATPQGSSRMLRREAGSTCWMVSITSHAMASMTLTLSERWLVT